MALISKNTRNNGSTVHYLDSFYDSDKSLTPLLICPGLSEVAEEYKDFIEYMLPRRCVALSFRGRGMSDTPKNGYDLQHHILDIVSVIKETSLDHFYLFGYSRGVSYALGYTRLYSERIEKLIIQDYPPEHKAMPVEWAHDYIENYIIPYKRINNIRPEAVYGIQRDSTQEQITFEFSKPVLVMRGLQKDSLLSNKGLEQYKIQFPEIQIEEFIESGHDIRRNERSKLYETIKRFLD
ncbi:MAG: alpha/beta fold hydrolase [Bacillota bacterium]